MQHHYDTINKQTQEDFFINICTSHFIVRVRKGLLKVCMWEGGGDRTETAIFWPPLLWPATLCLSCSPDAQLEAQWRSSLLDDSFLYCILSASSLDPNSSGPQAPSAWCGFPYHISSITPSPVVTGTATVLTSVLTELHNSSTPTQLPTRSLKSHVWSSSSGNNCHAVHRSLSSGASVYECTMGIFFTSSHFVSQFLPMWFPHITATRMCHLLPVHYLEWHFWPGRRSKCHKLI